jgi:type III pantothenate kinase
MSWVFLSGNLAPVVKIAKQYGISTCAICQSGMISDVDLKVLSSSFKKLINLTEETKIPIVNLYETPSSLGKDRLASAVAASFLFPKQNAIVINAGTCITMDFVDKNNQYHGGNISPGIAMRLKAMNKFTARLPLVEACLNKNLIGKTTKEALQNGAVRGAIYEVEAFISRLTKEYGSLKVIISGGDAYFFGNQSNFKIFAHPNLVLAGLNEILNFNGF